MANEPSPANFPSKTRLVANVELAGLGSLDELASIFAGGLLRLQARAVPSQTPNSPPDSGPSRLEVLPETVLSVPLWWDAGTLADLENWIAYRRKHGAKGGDPLVCSLQQATLGEPLNRHVLRLRFRTACRVLGWGRLRSLTIHHGRHTFISHALAGGRTLAEVKAAAGHASLLTTSVYLHVAVEDEGKVGDLFCLAK